MLCSSPRHGVDSRMSRADPGMGLGSGNRCCWFPRAPPQWHLAVPAPSHLPRRSSCHPAWMRAPAPAERVLGVFISWDLGTACRMLPCLLCSPHLHHTPCTITATPPKPVPSRDEGLGNLKCPARMQEGSSSPCDKCRCGASTWPLQ